MPGKQHVPLAIPASVTDQRKRQRVFVRPAKLINPRALAVFGSFAAGALNGNGITSDRVSAPDITFAVMVSAIKAPAKMMRREDCIFMVLILPRDA